MSAITIVPRKTASKNKFLIQMSKQLYQELLIEKPKIKISIGKKTIQLLIQTLDMNSTEVHFPEKLFLEFRLPIQLYKFHAVYKKETTTLYLGPVIGLVTNFSSKNIEEPNFGSIHSFCEELHQGIKESGGFFYVFIFPEFSYQGYYFENGKWLPAELPLPDVIYNRIHSRRLEYVDEFKDFREKLQQLNIPFFNDRFLSKWEVHEYLIKENHLQNYIPETRIYTKENFADFDQKYQTMFIKPIHGSQGRNIFKIEKQSNLFILKSSLKLDSLNSNDSFTFEEIHQLLKKLVNNRIYVIQQGVSLLTLESRGMDFRVLCHKNQSNNWEVTSVVARISAKDEFVSNIARGGEIMTPLNALGAVMRLKDPKSVLLQMKELAIETATIISTEAAGITGELGIDIGIDEDGKPWLIEVNSKPSKNFEDGQMKIRPSAKAIIQFCTKLAFDTLDDKGD